MRRACAILGHIHVAMRGQHRASYPASHPRLFVWKCNLVFTKRSRRLFEIAKRREELSSPYFRAGEVVPETGIYRVYHSGHRLSHDVTLMGDERFPRCSQCEYNVHFELVAAAPEVESDKDFRSLKLFELPHPEKKSA